MAFCQTAIGGVGGMKDYAKQFYSGYAWKQCRKAYAKSKGNLCERCLEKGLFTPGDIVHHKVYLTPDNINDPNITLNWDNLELVCHACHDMEHDVQSVHRQWCAKKRKRRFTVGENGKIICT